jgi:N-acetylmuramoyl-L-alanine amidase
MVKVWIDAGHGAQDSGACGNGLKEKDIVVEIARQLNKILEYGAETALSRQDDSFLTLSERAKRANAWGADVFVSIHCNSGGGKGFETFRFTTSDAKTIALQNVMHDALMSLYRQHGIVDRGKKSANYAVLRETRMPAVLTENLFMDNLEITKFKDIDFLIAVARAHAEGIAAYFGLQKKTTTIPSQPEPSVKEAIEPQIRYVYTGGFAGPSLLAVHDYLFSTGHNFDVKRGVDGSVVFLIGPFDTSQTNFKDCKNFLDRSGYQNALYTREQASTWK